MKGFESHGTRVSSSINSLSRVSEPKDVKRAEIIPQELERYHERGRSVMRSNSTCLWCQVKSSNVKLAIFGLQAGKYIQIPELYLTNKVLHRQWKFFESFAASFGVSVLNMR
jgi:hypothetical protein